MSTEKCLVCGLFVGKFSEEGVNFLGNFLQRKVYGNISRETVQGKCPHV